MEYSKYKGERVDKLFQHDCRGEGDNHNHSNEDIDPTRTKYNYSVAGGQSAELVSREYRQRIAEIKRSYKQEHGRELRKDAVTLCEWIVTLPKDLDSTKERDFFEGAYEFFCNRYGTDNILSANVHKDETTPHLHITFLPMQEGRLCAKDLETPKTLKQAHIDMQKHLSERLGCEVHILNGATENGNKTVLQMKNEELLKQIAALERKEASLMSEKLKPIADKLNLGKRITKAEAETIKDLQERLDTLEKKGLSLDEAIEHYKDLTERSQSVYNNRLDIATGVAQEKFKTYAACLEKEHRAEISSLQKEISSLKADKQRAERLEQFCDELQYGNGQSVLEAFEEQEYRNRKNKQNSFER